VDILKVGLFGCVRATHDDWATEIQLTRENQALLAYLLLYRHKMHPREILADMFWGEHTRQKARGSLNTALWKLKRALEPEGIPAGAYLKNSHAGEVGFNTESPYWLDIEVFERGITQVLSIPFETVEECHLIELYKVLELYNGDLLEGLYADWALRERERLRGSYVKSLVYLLQYYSFHHIDEKAIACGQQILDLEPMREEIHREMMKLYMANKQRVLAIRQYEICRDTLNKELSIEPMKETRDLYTKILSETNSNPSVGISNTEIKKDEVFRRLMEANRTIDLAKEQIRQALQELEQH
jgi:DNA-binding SARP family transcriptional activator